MTGRCLCLIVPLALACGACHSLDPGAPLGSRANPVRAHGLPGEFDYLAQLRCPDGTTPHVRGLLRRPPGPYGRGLDGYRVRCIYLNTEYVVYLDPFHADYAESRPVPGFTAR